MDAPWIQILRDARAGTLEETTVDRFTFGLSDQSPGDLILTVRIGAKRARFNRPIASIESPTHLRLLINKVQAKLDEAGP